MHSTISFVTRTILVAAIAPLLNHAAAERMGAEAFQEALASLKAYEIVEGENPHAEILASLDAAVIASQADASERAAHAASLAAFLADPASTRDARWFAARHLYHIAGAAEVPVIAPLLTDPDASDAAVYALQTIPGDEATQALIEALEAAVGRARVGLINALATRGDDAALPLLDEAAPLLSASGHELHEGALVEEASAALNAIGAIGGRGAFDILRDRLWSAQSDPLIGSVPVHFYMPYINPWLALAEHAAVVEDRTQALSIYTAYSAQFGPYALPVPRHVEIARALGVLRVQGDDHKGEYILEFLTSPEETLRDAAAAFLWEFEDAGQLGPITEAVPDLPESLRPRVVLALGHQQVAELAPIAATMAVGGSRAMQLAAIEALRGVGNAEHIPVLLTAATGEVQEVARAATRTLALIPAEGFNEALAGAMIEQRAPGRIAIIEALQARHATDATDALWTAAADDARDEVRLAAVRALGSIGGGADAERLGAQALEEDEESIREAMVAAMLVAARRNEAQPAVAAVLLNGVEADGLDPDIQASAIEALGRLEHPAALDALMQATSSEDTRIRGAAVRALSGWPSPEPLNVLFEIHEQSDDPGLSFLALRAATDMIQRLPDDDIDGKIGAYERAFELAASPQIMRMVFAGLSRMRGEEAFALASRYVDDESVQRDARFTVNRIRVNSITPSASHNDSEAGQAVDHNMDSRWSTRAVQHPGQWFQMDFDFPMQLAAFTLRTGRHDQDYPRGYAVTVTEDGETWTDAVVTGTGEPGDTRIVLDIPRVLHGLRVELTATADEHWWSIHGVEIEAEVAVPEESVEDAA